MNIQNNSNNKNSSENPFSLVSTDIKEDSIIKFPFGIPGFEFLTQYLISELKDYPPFFVLHSVEAPEVTMLILHTDLLRIKNQIVIPKKELQKIDAVNVKKIDTFVILKINNQTHEFTANLKAPLVINSENMKGLQVILENDDLSIEFPLANNFN